VEKLGYARAIGRHRASIRPSFGSIFHLNTSCTRRPWYGPHSARAQLAGVHVSRRQSAQGRRGRRRGPPSCRAEVQLSKGKRISVAQAPSASASAWAASSTRPLTRP
jgi:hypothetical protein